MGGERVICADGERVDGWGAVGDGVCGGAADYGDGEDGAGEGGDWGGMCFFFSSFLPLLFQTKGFLSFSFFFGLGEGRGENCIFSWDWEVLWDLDLWLHGDQVWMFLFLGGVFQLDSVANCA